MKKNMQKIAVACIATTVIAAFLFLDLGRYFSLPFIKDAQERLMVFSQGHRVQLVAAYMGIYIAVAALSLPGATALTLAAGALFGLTLGTLAVSFASSIGATFACLMSRFLLQEWVQKRFGAQLSTINKGIAKEGAFYLFSLRLVPIFPFFVINLLMGLSRMPLFTFFWVSQLGMLAGTVVYVNAGKELAHIDSLSGIMSPGLLLSLSLLGLFPIAAKKVLLLLRTGFRHAPAGGKAGGPSRKEDDHGAV